MIRLRVYWVALGVMRHVEAAYVQLRRRPPEDEQSNAWNM
jgi:hypothetical protein